MPIYKDTCRCQKCGERFTWCYTGSGAEWSACHTPDSCVELSGIMTVADEIYEVLVTCPSCGAINEFNCKIPGTLPGLKKIE